MSDDYKLLQLTLNEIKDEVKENRSEIIKLKQELATGKGAIRAVAFIGVIVTIIWTTLKIITYK